MLYGKIHYTWPFSIAMLVITRGYICLDILSTDELSSVPSLIPAFASGPLKTAIGPGSWEGWKGRTLKGQVGHAFKFFQPGYMGMSENGVYHQL